MKWRCFALAALVVVAGCATYKPVPDGYGGPTAILSDTGFPESGSKAQVFAATEIDGNRMHSSFGASASASYGKGASLTMQIVERYVPIRPMKVTLRASHATGAPIHAIAMQMAGTYYSVEGVVDFEPKASGRYAVKGELKKEGSSVWIEDVTTGQPVTVKITKP
jgi:hypothetical protein